MVILVEEIWSDLNILKGNVEEIMVSLDVTSMEKELKEYEFKMQEPSFWEDITKAQQITKLAKGIKDKIDRINLLISKIEDLEMLTQLSSDEGDDSSLVEIKVELKDLAHIADQFRLEILLSGKYDKNNAILTLHTGAGGSDAQDWTEMLYRMYSRWCEKKGYKVEVLDYQPSDEAGIKAVTLKITGEYAYGYLMAEKGVHRLVRISPFNANGKRQTSFASCEVLPELTEDQDIEIKPDDLRIDTYRSGGAGGQHVNKTDSAIRITHIPTGIVVQCQNERSQHSNKQTAMKMLMAKLLILKESEKKDRIEDLTGDLKENGWGSQIRSYVFHPYSMVKDHRTNIEVGNVDAVMDGDIDVFIEEYLRQSNK
ncbi:peptide chain release factor 2 [Clostridium estertheticum]|uniref:peptide chain release factor 2 n=1 Tax=Clostridium estertheticum TaxID=238834 RepID=UPI001C7DFE87|nr:peptide chain release factor 2 [Clostridium estertheticum]MBX4267099.1 peptide chain release factor 2 [Clostridium estertheticum]MBX4271571.1 peptide chain release factor 2 [Clostridium estertheticum]WLC80951.1 peptide chain release factor 2 [Clostridium estertheticum]WLC88014.1 peptide chain release factor 2 [Clostridium estertheticum]